MGRKHHWLHAILWFVIAVAAGVLLIPLVRSTPVAVHSYANGLHGWQRNGLAFLFCILFSYTLFKLFSPRLAHLRFLLTHPPTWFAFLFGVVLVGLVDVLIGLDPSGYRATWEWLFYAGGSILIVALYRHLFNPPPKKPLPTSPTKALQLQSIAEAKWMDIEEWLRSDAPAEYDFLNNREVADRLRRMISEGIRSVGVVGPFGAGKTSIVEWVIAALSTGTKESPRIFVSRHSCWGFETSRSSIHEMLASAIKIIEQEIDAFHVRSLPDSYRQTFAAGGQWVEKISNIVLERADPSSQFMALSAMLSDMDARLLLVIEDLDRNDSRSFDIQEVLAFLEQLKGHANLAFILTGGLDSSRRIDFAKLCDHFEYLKTVDAKAAAEMVERVYERCIDVSTFPHEVLGDPNRHFKWNVLSGLMLRDYEELSLPEAVAFLLNTPRSLRHALGRTWAAWKSLCGEIDLNHLLAVNVLRCGAPECFQFLMRRWDRLRSIPRANPSFGKENLERIRQGVMLDWERTILDVEWNPTAALTVMEFVLPASKQWLTKDSSGGSTGDAPQSIQHERYWRRVVNETIGTTEVRDQTVVRDLRKWMGNPSIESEMIAQLCKSKEYGEVWEPLAAAILAGSPEQLLLISEHTLSRILREHGAAASHDSLGFAVAWRCASQRFAGRPENQEWLKVRISEASLVSLEMTYSLWHYYGTSGRYSIICREDANAIRQHQIQTLRTVLTDGMTFERLIDQKYPWILYQLVFDPGDHNPQKVADIGAWTWITPILLESLRRGNTTVAKCVANLVAGQHSRAVDPEVLFAFFPNDAGEVAERLEELAGHLEDVEQREYVRAIAESAKGAVRQRKAKGENP